LADGVKTADWHCYSAGQGATTRRMGHQPTFQPPLQSAADTCQAARLGAGQTLESEWGLALHLESRKGQETRQYLLDFGFMPTTYQNNLAILKIDVSKIPRNISFHCAPLLAATSPALESDVRGTKPTWPSAQC
jgi:hypothetical protein